MLEMLKMYKAFLFAQKEGFKGRFNEYEAYIIKDKILEKEMPLIYSDEDMSNVYRLLPLKKNGHKYYASISSFYLERPQGMIQDEVFKVISHNLSYFVMYYKNSSLDINKALESTLIKLYGFNPILREEVKGREIVDLCFSYDYDLAFLSSPFYKNHFLLLIS